VDLFPYCGKISKKWFADWSAKFGQVVDLLAHIPQTELVKKNKFGDITNL
jgi:hypothetical protein